MSEPTFAQSGRRQFVVPILLATAILGAAGGVIYYKAAGRTVVATVTHTIAHPIKTVYKAAPQQGSFKVLKVQEGESDLYLVPTVRIENHLDVPLFVKDFAITIYNADGGMRASAIEKDDLEVVYASLPEIKPLMAMPLLRETSIAPGAAVEGTLLAQFPIAESAWEQRQSATVTIDFYHAPSMTIPIPKP